MEEQFVEILKAAADSDSYDGFRKLVSDAFSERPELLDCSDCSKETVELFREGFSSENFQEMKAVFSSSEIICSGKIVCSRVRFQEAILRSNDYDQGFREKLTML